MGIETNKFDARLDLVPYEPGVYLMKDASGAIIYVGKAKSLRNRLRSYFGSGKITHPKVSAMVSHVADFEYIIVGSEEEALLLEDNLIKHYRPQYNILLMDDKSFPYVCITLNEEYPRVFKMFRPDSKLAKKGALYYGPYMGADLYHTLNAINDIFPLKKCRKVLPRDIGKERPCLNAHIGKCMAPCSGGVTSTEYRNMIFDIVAFFEGRFDGIEAKLQETMEAQAEAMEFEKAASTRDRLKALRNISKNQKIFLNIKRDIDAIGLYSDAGETAIRKLEVRDGKIVGSSVYFLKGDSESGSDVLKTFLMQYYEHAPMLPPTILIPEPIIEEGESITSLIESSLSTLHSKKVKLHVPSRGELKSLSNLANLNAREMMVRRIMRGGGQGSDPMGAVAVLESLTGREKGSIRRIESYDISNLGNDDICSGMVVFKDGKPDKSSYRLFKMKWVTTQDDFSSMSETLRRRFKHSEKDGFQLPDLILVDGGKGQLARVASVVRESFSDKEISLLGMVKNSKHKTAGLLTEGGEYMSLEGENLEDEQVLLLRFVAAVQNEVHRYAITYQRKLMKKRNISYKLENIEGIGPAKRKLLLNHFKTIKAVSDASLEALNEVKGISPTDALNVYNYFRS